MAKRTPREIREQIIRQRKGTPQREAERAAASKARQASGQFATVGQAKQFYSNLQPGVKRRLDPSKVEKQQKERISKVQQKIQETEQKLKEHKERLEKQKQRYKDKREYYREQKNRGRYDSERYSRNIERAEKRLEREEQKYEERTAEDQGELKGYREGLSKLQEGNIIETKDIQRFARQKGDVAETKVENRYSRQKQRRQFKEGFKETTGIDYDTAMRSFSPGAKADLFSRYTAKKEGITKAEAEKKLVEEGKITYDTPESYFKTEKIPATVITGAPEAGGIIRGPGKDVVKRGDEVLFLPKPDTPKISRPKSLQETRTDFQEPKDIEIRTEPYIEKRQVKTFFVDPTVEGKQFEKQIFPEETPSAIRYELPKGYEPIVVEKELEASERGMKTQPVSSFFERSPTGGLKGFKGLISEQNLGQVQEDILIKSRFGTPERTRKESVTKFGSGLALSGVQTLQAVRSPIQTIKGIPGGVVDLSKRITSGRGFPEIGRIIRQEPSFAAGYLTSEVGQAYLGGKLIQSVRPARKVKTPKTRAKIDITRSELPKGKRTPLSKTFQDGFRVGTKKDKILTRIDIQRPDILDLSLKRQKAATRFRKARDIALKRPEISRAQRLVQQQVDNFKKSIRGLSLERQKKAKAFRARKAKVETPVKFDLDDFYVKQSKKRLETAQDIFVYDKKTGGFKRIEAKPRFKKKTGQIKVKKAGEPDTGITFTVDRSKAEKYIQRLRDKQSERRLLQSQKQKSKQVQQQVLLEKPKQKPKKPETVVKILSPEELQKVKKQSQRLKQQLAPKQKQKQIARPRLTQKAQFKELTKTQQAFFPVAIPKLASKTISKQQTFTKTLEKSALKEVATTKPKTKTATKLAPAVTVMEIAKPKAIPKSAITPRMLPRITPTLRMKTPTKKVVKPRSRRPKKRQFTERKLPGEFREFAVLPQGFTAAQLGLTKQITSSEAERLVNAPSQAFGIRRGYRIVNNVPKKKKKKKRKLYKLEGLDFTIPKGVIQ